MKTLIAATLVALSTVAAAPAFAGFGDDWFGSDVGCQADIGEVTDRCDASNPSYPDLPTDFSLEAGMEVFDRTGAHGFGDWLGNFHDGSATVYEISLLSHYVLTSDDDDYKDTFRTYSFTNDAIYGGAPNPLNIQPIHDSKGFDVAPGIVDWSNGVDFDITIEGNTYNQGLFD